MGVVAVRLRPLAEDVRQFPGGKKIDFQSVFHCPLLSLSLLQAQSTSCVVSPDALTFYTFEVD